MQEHYPAWFIAMAIWQGIPHVNFARRLWSPFTWYIWYPDRRLNPWGRLGLWGRLEERHTENRIVRTHKQERERDTHGETESEKEKERERKKTKRKKWRAKWREGLANVTCTALSLYIYICCEVIIWSKFRGFGKLLSGPSWVFGGYYLVQVCVFSL